MIKTDDGLPMRNHALSEPKAPVRIGLPKHMACFSENSCRPLLQEKLNAQLFSTQTALKGRSLAR
ncbi:MAG: hypothetical protein PVH18_06145, partial [Chloroflexota bacterium]